jgi:hypothetical protein
MHFQQTQRARFLLLGAAAILAAGVVACGDDDDDTASAEACSSLVEFNTAASGDGQTDTSTPEGAKALGSVLAPLWEDARDAIPASAKSDTEVVTDAINDLQAGDGAAFAADATFESFNRALTGAIGQCDFAEQAVTATESNGEYRFKGISDSMEPGVVAMSLKNEGVEPHVMVVFRKNDGETRTAEELLALPEEEGQAAGTDVGGVFAEPGASSVGLVNLTPGNYVYFCPIPIGGGDDGPPHFTQGMYGEFTVS